MRKKFSIILLVLFCSSFVLAEINSINAAEKIDTQIVNSSGQKYVDNTDAQLTEEGVVVQKSGLLSAIIVGINNVLLGEVVQLKDAQGNPIEGKDYQVYYSQAGAVDSTALFNSHFYENPPASGIVYAQQEWNQITKGHKSYAAEDSWIYYPGLGFQVLQPIQEYWVAARNLAYVGLIIIIIMVSLMVIFRGYVGGQAQVTIANSIPNIIVALVMITLSYAMSGLAIDLITVGINLSQQVLVQNEWSPGYEVWQADEITTHPIVPLRLVPTEGDANNVAREYIEQLTEGLESLTPEMILDDPDFNNYTSQVGSKESPVRYHLQPDDTAMSVWGIYSTSNITISSGDGLDIAEYLPSGGITGAIKNIVKGADGSFSGLLDNLLALVLGLSAFMTAFKLFLELIKKYLVLILYPVISPFLMLTIAIPGQSGETIQKYFKTLFSASLTFIVIYIIFLFMIILTTDTQFIVLQEFSPAMMGFSIPDIEENPEVRVGTFIRNILAFAMFLATPTIPKVIDETLLNQQFKAEPTAATLGSGIAQRFKPAQERFGKIAVGGYNLATGRRNSENAQKGKGQ